MEPRSRTGLGDDTAYDSRSQQKGAAVSKTQKRHVEMTPHIEQHADALLTAVPFGYSGTRFAPPTVSETAAPHDITGAESYVRVRSADARWKAVAFSADTVNSEKPVNAGRPITAVVAKSSKVGAAGVAENSRRTSRGPRNEKRAAPTSTVLLMRIGSTAEAEVTRTAATRESSEAMVQVV